jgi:hypothetical protein
MPLACVIVIEPSCIDFALLYKKLFHLLVAAIAAVISSWTRAIAVQHIAAPKLEVVAKLAYQVLAPH